MGKGSKKPNTKPGSIVNANLQRPPLTKVPVFQFPPTISLPINLRSPLILDTQESKDRFTRLSLVQWELSEP